MSHDNTLTSLNQQDSMETNPILQYFTANRHQEPEYEDTNSFKSVCDSSKKHFH